MTLNTIIKTLLVVKDWNLLFSLVDLKNWFAYIFTHFTHEKKTANQLFFVKISVFLHFVKKNSLNIFLEWYPQKSQKKWMWLYRIGNICLFALFGVFIAIFEYSPNECKFHDYDQWSKCYCFWSFDIGLIRPLWQRRSCGQ